MIEEVRLIDLLTLQRGFDITKKEQVSGDIPVISSGGISSYHNKHKVNGPGVVVGRKGTLGTVFYTDKNFWPHDTSLWIKDFKGNDPKFTYYLLQVLHFEKFDTGAANPTLNRNHVHSLKLNVPKKQYRSKIANILSAYDDLIENNKQRIQLLEEMAAEIYKEWFVRFRFPGYASASFVDKEGKEVPQGTDGALPLGWEKSLLKNHLEYFRGKSYTSKELRDNEGLAMLNLKNVNRGGGFRRDGLKYFEGKYNPNNEAKSGDIIMAVTDMTQQRDLVGRVARVPNMGYEKFIISMDLIRIEPINLPKTYFYAFLRYSGIGLELKEFANGANVLHLTPELIKYRKAIIPSIELCHKFEELILPMLDEIDLLEIKNKTLQQTRDLLLPRLISGKLSVENLVLPKEKKA